MKEKLHKILTIFLQPFANYIVYKMMVTTNSYEYETLLTFGLLLNDWCVDKGIWLE